MHVPAIVSWTNREGVAGEWINSGTYTRTRVRTYDKMTKWQHAHFTVKLPWRKLTIIAAQSDKCKSKQIYILSLSIAVKSSGSTQYIRTNNVRTTKRHLYSCPGGKSTLRYLLVKGTPNRLESAMAIWAKPQARAKFLARTFSKMYILSE